MFTVKPVGKEFGVYLNDELIGTAKLLCDAQFHCYRLRGACGDKSELGIPGPGLQDPCPDNSGLDKPGSV